MATADTIHECCSVYPGEYKPVKFDRSQMQQWLNNPRSQTTQPVAEVTNYRDHYKIEISAPGHTPDNFIVTTGNGRLYVFAIERTSQTPGAPLPRSNNPYPGIFECEVCLPRDVDPDFVFAEYKEGLLTFRFHKTNKPVRNSVHRIAVY